MKELLIPFRTDWKTIKETKRRIAELYPRDQFYSDYKMTPKEAEERLMRNVREGFIKRATRDLYVGKHITKSSNHYKVNVLVSHVPPCGRHRNVLLGMMQYKSSDSEGNNPIDGRIQFCIPDNFYRKWHY